MHTFTAADNGALAVAGATLRPTTMKTVKVMRSASPAVKKNALSLHAHRQAGRQAQREGVCDSCTEADTHAHRQGREPRETQSAGAIVALPQHEVQSYLMLTMALETMNASAMDANRRWREARL